MNTGYIKQDISAVYLNIKVTIHQSYHMIDHLSLLDSSLLH